MKALFLGLLMASPPVTAWILRGAENAGQNAPIQTLVTPIEPAVKVPVEVVSKGSPPQWVYVEVSQQAVPEPGVVSLLAVASLMLLRRQRPAGK